MSNAAKLSHKESEFHEFSSAKALHAALAKDVAQRLTASVAERGRASLVAPGGTTPAAFFDVLARTPAPWKATDVTLSDDRWQESASLPTNESMLRKHLLVEDAAPARFVSLRNPASSAEAAEADIDATIAAIRRPFDVTLLGMGTDGHVASLLPGAVELDRALDWKNPALVRALRPHEASTDERITLTLRAILDSRWIALLLRGPAKREALAWAIDGSDISEAPVRAVLRQRDTPVSIFWAP